MIRRTGDDVVNVYTERKIKRKRTGGGGLVAIVTEPEDKFIEFHFSRDGVYVTIRPSRSGINRGNGSGKGTYYNLPIHE